MGAFAVGRIEHDSEREIDPPLRGRDGSEFRSPWELVVALLRVGLFVLTNLEIGYCNGPEISHSETCIDENCGR